jgi:hypothetical protein
MQMKVLQEGGGMLQMRRKREPGSPGLVIDVGQRKTRCDYYPINLTGNHLYACV